MNNAPDTQNKVGLVIAAHPDDAEFGAGGTTALWIKQGWEMHYLVVTNGAKGTSDSTMKPKKLIEIRKKEQQNAADVLGVKSCLFLDNEDGELEYTRHTLGEIVRAIRAIKPHAVLTHAHQPIYRRFLKPDPNDPIHEFRGSVNHRDHRNTSIMTIDAVYPTARDVLNFPEHIDQGLEPHKVVELFMWTSHDANFKIDITDAIDQKVKALAQHESQFEDNSEQAIKQIMEHWRHTDGKLYERFERLVLRV